MTVTSFNTSVDWEAALRKSNFPRQKVDQFCNAGMVCSTSMIASTPMFPCFLTISTVLHDSLVQALRSFRKLTSRLVKTVFISPNTNEWRLGHVPACSQQVCAHVNMCLLIHSWNALQGVCARMTTLMQLTRKPLLKYHRHASGTAPPW